MEFESDDSYPGYFDFYFTGSSADEMNVYKDYLVAAGWKVLGEANGDYELGYKNTDARVDLIDYDDYINVSFFDGFPRTTIYTDLMNLGIDATDLPPRLTGSAKTYQYNSNAHQLLAIVDEGKEAATVAQYQLDLQAAGFVEGEDDGVYGMHYISPNQQLDVVVWDAAALIGYTGYVVINFKKIVTSVSSALELMEQIGIYAWGGVEDGDFKEPDAKGIVASKYTINATSYATVTPADSEDWLPTILICHCWPNIHTKCNQWFNRCLTNLLNYKR